MSWPPRLAVLASVATACTLPVKEFTTGQARSWLGMEPNLGTYNTELADCTVSWIHEDEDLSEESVYDASGRLVVATSTTPSTETSTELSWDGPCVQRTGVDGGGSMRTVTEADCDDGGWPERWTVTVEDSDGATLSEQTIASLSEYEGDDLVSATIAISDTSTVTTSYLWSANRMGRRQTDTDEVTDLVEEYWWNDDGWLSKATFTTNLEAVEPNEVHWSCRYDDLGRLEARSVGDERVEEWHYEGGSRWPEGVYIEGVGSIDLDYSCPET